MYQPLYTSKIWLIRSSISISRVLGAVYYSLHEFAEGAAACCLKFFFITGFLRSNSGDSIEVYIFIIYRWQREQSMLLPEVFAVLIRRSLTRLPSENHHLELIYLPRY